MPSARKARRGIGLTRRAHNDFRARDAATRGKSEAILRIEQFRRGFRERHAQRVHRVARAGCA
jgi:hypothetical protein